MRRRILLALIASASMIAIVAASYVVVPAAPGHPVPTASAAAVDYFLKIDGIDGESRDQQHHNEIDIQSFSWGVSQNTGAFGGGGGTGKATFDALHIMKTIDKASPILFQSVPEGKHYKEAVLVGRKPDGFEFMKIKLSDVLISSFQQSGGGDRPTESVSLNFSKIVFEYTVQNSDGKTGEVIHGGWDLKKNEKI